MKIHFIAIGGSAMHNLAMALKLKGNIVSGSDDEVFEPSKSRLEALGLLPDRWGWFPEKIDKSIDAVILGMHAKKDNPELLKAMQLGIKVYSYPEYLRKETEHKTRIVIGGSHGKTTITSMLMHIMKSAGLKFDYMVGAIIDGFDTMVNLEEDNRIAIFEGDEYLSSPIDLTPKFHHYSPNIAVVSGIAWDHINVFNTFDIYKEQFRIFIDKIEPNGCIIYNENDDNLRQIVEKAENNINKIPYKSLQSYRKDKVNFITIDGEEVSLNIFGEHNMENMSAALNVCRQIGLKDSDFAKGISTFKGADKRLNKIAQNNSSIAFLDFAHSPSKIKATMKAVKDEYPNHNIIACAELHTFSSLNPDFMKEYKDTINLADTAYIYYNEEVVKNKGILGLSPEIIKNGFANDNIIVKTNKNDFITSLQSENFTNTILLFMSSGNFGGINLKEFSENLLYDNISL